MENVHNHYAELSEQMQSFFAAMRAEHAKLIAESNQQAMEARALIARVQATARKHEALESIMGRATEEVEKESDNMSAIIGNIKDAMKDILESDMPECEVEKFEGYCEGCGAELTSDDVWSYDADGTMLCEACALQQSEEDDDEIVLDEAESV